MAYIAPNSVIRFIKDVPLESDYEHTIYFKTMSEQLTYFFSFTKADSGGYSFTLREQSYQRFAKNKLRVAIPVEQLYDCNYIMFQNTSFSQKWFYAFITGIDYVNNTTAEVSYELDVIQSWMFNADGTRCWRFSRCFIERQHTSDDTIGANTQPENLELGDYFYEEQAIDDDPFETWYIVVATTFSSTSTSPFPIADGVLFNNVYSGLYFHIFPSTAIGVNDVNTFLKAVTSANESDGVVSIFMYPYDLFGQVYHDSKTITIPLDRPSSLGSYTPRNKKLLTYPYNMIYVTDNNGTSGEFKYEYFTTAYTNCWFELRGALSCAPEIMLYPTDYKGVVNCVNERMIMSNLPQCAYTIDSYRAWLAMATNRVNYQSDVIAGRLNLVGGAVNAAESLITADLSRVFSGSSGIVSGAQQFNSGAEQISKAIAQKTDARTTPPQLKGSTSNGVVLAGTNNLRYSFYQAYIREEYAKIIDGYFDMFGYATNTVGIPNITSRKYWNYIKTKNCLLGGGLPAIVETELCAIFNKGITFWHDGTQVGNYTLTNSILS